MTPPLRSAAKAGSNYPRLAPAMLLAVALLSACAKVKPPQIAYDDPPVAATLIPEPPRPVEVVEVPTPLPLPGQLKSIEPDDSPTDPPSPEPRAPADRVAQANAAARVEPVRDGFINAVQVYPFSAGALYQVYAAPGQVTDIALQDGEGLVGAGPIAAGDTVRWIVGDTESGSGENLNDLVIRRMARGHVYSDPNWLTAERLADKRPVAHAAGARFASIRFVTGALDPFETGEAFRAAAMAMADRLLLVWGAETPRKSLAEMQALAATLRAAPVVLPRGKLGVHEEFPHDVGSAIRSLLSAADDARLPNKLD